MVAKIILGVIILAVGLWLLLPLGMGLPYYQGSTWNDFKVVFWGTLPLILIFLGGLMAWIEMEDMRAEKR